MPQACGCRTGREASSAACLACRVASFKARRAAGVLRTTMGASTMVVVGRQARRGESAGAPAVPTGSTVVTQKVTGGRHQTKGPKALPVPVEPAGRAVRLDAPLTFRAWPPRLLSAYAHSPQVPGTQARRHPAERRTRRCSRRRGPVAVLEFIAHSAPAAAERRCSARERSLL